MIRLWSLVSLIGLFWFGQVHASAWYVHQNEGLNHTFPTQWTEILDPVQWSVGSIPKNGGTFWFKTSIEIKDNLPEDQAMLLQIGLMPCSDEIFWDDQIIGASGFQHSVPVSIRQRQRAYLVPQKLLTQGSHDVIIKIYKSKDDVRKFITFPPQLTKYSKGAYEKEFDYLRTSDFPLMSAIILLWLGSFFFLFFYFHKSFDQYLFFSISCTLVSLFLFFDAWKLQELGLPSIWALKISLIASVWSILSLSKYFKILLKYPDISLHKIERFYSMAMTLGMLIVPHRDNVQLVLNLWFPVVIFNVFYLTYQLVRSIMAEKKIGDMFVLVSFVGLGASIMFDMYVYSFIGNTPPIFPYTFLLFAFGTASQLIRNYGAALNDRNIQADVKKKSIDLETTLHLDSLTKLNNRRSFEMFQETVSEYEISVMGLMIVDIDHFKIYNDTYGHPAGDRLLQSIGWLFNQWKSPIDKVYRIGGEEFVVVVNNQEPESFIRYIERLRSLIESFPFDFMNGNGQHVTVSIGAVFRNETNKTVAQMYSAADQRLYVAKKIRNTIVYTD